MTVEGLPWRGPGPREARAAAAAGRVPLRRNGSWRKRWRYLGAFSDELLLCAARVQVGPVGQTFWAIWERERRRAARAHADDRPGARPRRGLDPGARGRATRAGSTGRPRAAGRWSGSRPRRARDAERVRAFLHAGRGRLGGGDLPHRRGRQLRLDAQARGPGRVRRADRRAPDPRRGARDRGRVLRLSPPSHGLGLVGGGRRDHATAAPSAGTWSPGSTIPQQGSERAIWVDGVAAPSRRRRASRASRRSSSTAARLEFTAEAERRKEQGSPFAYSYRQPFGTFTGTLPGGLELASGPRGDGAPRGQLVAAGSAGRHPG